MGTFRDELTRWGPEGTALVAASLARGSAEAYCRRLARSHYENFAVVSWLLPRCLHQHFFNVYAFCRWADDLADEIDDPKESTELLAWWRSELRQCYAGAIRHPVFVALSGTIADFTIPIHPFEDLISAFQQDQIVAEYASFDQLADYCRRSANPVGRLVLYVCRQVGEANFGWSDSICTGLQLANFWQDVDRDFEVGRIYLPQEDRDHFGYSDRDLRRREYNRAFRELMAFEVDRARQFLLAGLPLIDRLPRRLQIDVELFARGGLRILERIERINFAVWQRRPVVTHTDRTRLLIACVVRALSRWCGLSSTQTAGLPHTSESRGCLP